MRKKKKMMRMKTVAHRHISKTTKIKKLISKIRMKKRSKKKKMIEFKLRFINNSYRFRLIKLVTYSNSSNSYMLSNYKQIIFRILMKTMMKNRLILKTIRVIMETVMMTIMMKVRKVTRSMTCHLVILITSTNFNSRDSSNSSNIKKIKMKRMIMMISILKKKTKMRRRMKKMIRKLER